jgi:Protein of unknown function (DUF3106)
MTRPTVTHTYAEGSELLTARPTRIGTGWRLAATLASAWVVFGSAAIEWPGKESQSYKVNLARLERMSQDQRQSVWQKYQEFLALPISERERVRKLAAELQKLPPEKRDRYRAIMGRYMKWKNSLPLYQQQMLEHAAKEGSTELYSRFREVQARKENEDRLREYWFVPDAPGVRKAIPKVLAKLTPEEIEELDQAPPLDRTEKLINTAQRLDMPAAGPAAFMRPWLRGPVPPPDPEKFKNWLQTLPREQLERLGDLGPLKKNAREKQLFLLYYQQHPDELSRARMRKGEGGMDFPRPGERIPRPRGSDSDGPSPSDGKEPAKSSGKQPSIPPK